MGVGWWNGESSLGCAEMKAVVCQPRAEAQMLLEVRLKLGTREAEPHTLTLKHLRPQLPSEQAKEGGRADTEPQNAVQEGCPSCWPGQHSLLGALKGGGGGGRGRRNCPPLRQHHPGA